MMRSRGWSGCSVHTEAEFFRCSREDILPPPGEIPQHTEDGGQKPGQAGGNPDYPDLRGGRIRHQAGQPRGALKGEPHFRAQQTKQKQGEAHSADDFHHAVEQGEEGVPDAVENPAAGIDNAQEDIEDAGDLQGLTVQGDDGFLADEESDQLPVEELHQQDHESGDDHSGQHAGPEPGTEPVHFFRAHILAGIGGQGHAQGAEGLLYQLLQPGGGGIGRQGIGPQHPSDNHGIRQIIGLL